MEGEESLPRFSPEITAKKSSAEAIALLPHIVLMHGTADYSIPSSARFDYSYFWRSSFERFILGYLKRLHIFIPVFRLSCCFPQIQIE
jgi:prenylcysteine alpha-carboxyl methylesterase